MTSSTQKSIPALKKGKSKRPMMPVKKVDIEAYQEGLIGKISGEDAEQASAAVGASAESVPSGQKRPQPPSKVAGGSNLYKRSRMQVIKPDFDDTTFADILLKLNDARYLICGNDNEGEVVIRIQDCAFRKLAGDEKFVPRAVKLLPQQFIDMINLDAEIKKGLEGDDHTRAHIGGNTYVTVKPEYGVIDIREFFLPPDQTRDTAIDPALFSDMVIPTKRGVMLSPAGWSRVISKGIDIVLEYGGANFPQNLGCGGTHDDNDAEFNACKHCNPNGYKHY